MMWEWKAPHARSLQRYGRASEILASYGASRANVLKLGAIEPLSNRRLTRRSREGGNLYGSCARSPPDGDEELLVQQINAVSSG